MSLTDDEMVRELERMRPPMDRVILGNCQFCGTPVVIAGTMRSLRRHLPPSPNQGQWRAFERRPVHSPAAWRSSKRYGFVPARDGEGFLPHACPKGEMH